MPLLRSFLSKGPFPNFAVKGLTVLFILQAVVLYLQVQFRTKTSLLERDWVGECERHNKAQQALATIHENPGKSLVQNRRLSKASGGSAALFVEVPIEELGNQIKEIHLKIRDISLRQNCIGNRVLKRTRQCFQLKESLDKKDQLYCASEAQFFAPGRGSRSKLGDVSTIPKRLINQLPKYGNCPDEIYMHQNIQYTGGGGSGGGGPGLGLCAATHADGPYLAEWLAFHRIQGFTHFVLYSLSNKKNKINSTRIYAKVLKDIKSTEKISEAVAAWGDGVTLVGPEEVPGVDPEAAAAAAADGGGAGAAPGLWAALLADCRHRLGNQSVEWAAWLGGAHEFLFPLDPEGEGGQTVASTITNLVSSETNHLGAIRFEYGSNFHTKRPASWHIKRYDLTTQMFFSRSRLDPNSTNSGGVVMARLSSLGAPPPAPWAAPPHGGGGAEERGVVPAVFRINRYTRSLQDLDYKAQTFFWEHQDGSSRKKFTSRVQSDAFYNFIERDRNEVVDPAAARYGCALRVALARACAAPWPALLPAKRDSRREPPSTWAADTSRWVALHSHVHEYLMQAKNIKKKCDANDQRGGAMKEISNYIENNLSSVVGEDDAENTKKDQADDDDAAELSYDDDYHAEAEDYNTEEDNEEQTDDQEWDFQEEEEEEEEEISTSRATTDKYNHPEEEENQEATTTSPY